MDPQLLASRLDKEIQRRRTFAIISHPDAGKTTLTEKLLLYGGAIHLAGAVKAKAASQRHTTSDWMEIEKQRGISISTSVLQFEYNGIQINLLDTPGHKDFSEDTYRTLAAVDAAVMLIDAAKGVEPQTRKLFEVCRMRQIPIFTFINKLDKPGRDPLDLLDELEKVLGIRSCPMNWPIGMGPSFKGIYDRASNDLLLFDAGHNANVSTAIKSVSFKGVDDPKILDHLGFDGDEEGDREAAHDRLMGEVELLELAGDAFDHEKVLQGQLSPVFFGSAMNNFGVERFLQRFIELAPAPGPRASRSGPVEPRHTGFSGFIFKIQANMDRLHRDRVAFLRVCSGRFERNMDARHARLGETIKLSRPLQFFGQDRVIVEEAWPGDVIGLVDTSGNLRIGDTLCTGPVVEYEGIPRFSPEHFASATIVDPLKRKQMKKGVDQLSEEGVVQVYRRPGTGDRDPILGAVGVLQFEVFQHRLQTEYGVAIRIERLPFTICRWVKGPVKESGHFNGREDAMLLEDRDGLNVVLFATDWGLRWALNNYKTLEFFSSSPLLAGQ